MATFSPLGSGRYRRGLSLHTFRHTAASLLFERGVIVVQVERWLGYHSARFTMDTYIHWMVEEDLGQPLCWSMSYLMMVGADGEQDPPKQSKAPSPSKASICRYSPQIARRRTTQ